MREPKHVGVFIVTLILIYLELTQEVMCISWILIKEMRFDFFIQILSEM
jgi:hypothetical protein